MPHNLENAWRRVGGALALDKKERALARRIAGLEAQLDASVAERERAQACLERDLVEARGALSEARAASDDLQAALGQAKDALAAQEQGAEKLRLSAKRRRRTVKRLEAELEQVRGEVAALRGCVEGARRVLQSNLPSSTLEALAVLEGARGRTGSTTQRAAVMASGQPFEGMYREIERQRGFSFEQALCISARGGLGRGGTVLLNDTRTQNNVGCRATTCALLEGLREAGVGVTHTVTLLELKEAWRTLADEVDAAPEPDNLHHFVDAFEASAALAWYRELIASCSSVVVNGEGSFYDRQGKGLVLCVLALHASTVLRKEVAFVNVSASLTDEVMRAWACEAFAASRGVWLREKRSMEWLQGTPAREVARESADAAFALTSVPVQPLEDWQWMGLSPDELLWRFPRKPYVVFTGTSSLFRADREPASPWEAVDLLLCALDARGFDVVLYAADQSDGVLLRAGAVRHGLPFVSAATPVPVVRSLLQGADAMVGGRWHAAILAASTGTPTVLGDANFFKTEALHDFLGLPNAMFEYRKLSEHQDAIVSAVAQFSEQGAAIREPVLDRARTAQQTFVRTMRDLAAAIGASSRAPATGDVA